MPRRGDQQRDVKLTDPLAELGAGAVLPEQRIVKKNTVKAGATGSGRDAAKPPIEEDKYEYYSSEDEQGRRV